MATNDYKFYTDTTGLTTTTGSAGPSVTSITTAAGVTYNTSATTAGNYVVWIDYPINYVTTSTTLPINLDFTTPKDPYPNETIRTRMAAEIKQTIENAVPHSETVAKKPELIEGLTIQECFERYNRALDYEVDSLKLASNTWVRWPFRIMKNSDGRRFVGLCNEVTKHLHAADFESVAAMLGAYSLSCRQLEAAQKEWSRRVKDKASKVKDTDRLQIVVDNSIPGEYDE